MGRRASVNGQLKNVNVCGFLDFILGYPSVICQVGARQRIFGRFGEITIMIIFSEIGAEQLGWELDKLMEQTILAMRSCEDRVNKEMEELEF